MQHTVALYTIITVCLTHFPGLVFSVFLQIISSLWAPGLVSPDLSPCIKRALFRDNGQGHARTHMNTPPETDEMPSENGVA